MFESAVAAGELLLKLLKGRRLASRRLFESHVQPLFEQLLRVHEEYVRAFDHVLQLLEDETVPFEALLSQMQREEQALRHLRILVGHLAAALRLSEAGDQLRSARSLRRRRSQRSASEKAFAFAYEVHRYFVRASGEVVGVGGTRMTGLLDVLEDCVAKRRSREEAWQWIIGVRDGLPAEWTNLSRAYADLRLACLR